MIFNYFMSESSVIFLSNNLQEKYNVAIYTRLIHILMYIGGERLKIVKKHARLTF